MELSQSGTAEHGAAAAHVEPLSRARDTLASRLRCPCCPRLDKRINSRIYRASGTSSSLETGEPWDRVHARTRNPGPRPPKRMYPKILPRGECPENRGATLSRLHISRRVHWKRGRVHRRPVSTSTRAW